jgi:hypothetical protein
MAAIPPVTQNQPDCVGPILEKVGNVVGLILNALAIVRPIGLNLGFAHSVTIYKQSIEALGTNICPS